jgi:hypothetical protein
MNAKLVQIETSPAKGQLQNFVEIGQTRFAGEPEAAPNKGTHSVKNRPELVNGKSCRIVHPNTLLQFAPGILHSQTEITLRAELVKEFP